MDLSQIKGLIEAYRGVHLPQEVDESTAMAKRGLDEPAIRTQIAKNTGGGAAADRATELANKKTYGQSGVDPKARENLARKQRGDHRKTASSNPGLKGYAHKATNDADRAKQAARGAQRGSAALTPNERKQLNMGDETFDIFDLVLEFLCVEGYAETLEEAEWLMANRIDEEAIEIILGEEQLDEISLKTKMKAYSASRDVDADYNYGSKVHDQGDRIKKAIVKKHGEKAGEHAERAAEVQNFGRGTPRAKPRIEKNRTYRTTKAGSMHGQDQAKLKSDLKKRRNEEYMDEAQEARNNPEKYEREQSKKSAPVRGEKTPMPPRGDKRREDFEKWYAANVR